MRFHAHQEESAILGYLALQGFMGAKAPCHPEVFSDERWRVIYRAAYALNEAGAVVNRFSITDELQRTGVPRSFEELFPLGWQTWPSAVDSSIALCSPAVLDDCFAAVAECALRRRAAEIGKGLAEGVVSVAEAADRIREVKEAASSGSLDAMLAGLAFDPEKPPPPRRRVYELACKIVATSGNLMAISGKAKSAKSAACSALIAAATGRDGDTLSFASINENGHALVHVDTEQSDADHHLLVAGALTRVNLAERPPWLFSYRMAVVPVARRFDLLEHAVRRARRLCKGVHSVIIDGVADLVQDPNDPAEAFAAVERLHQMAIEYDTVVVTVIHVNPSAENGKTRGHLGSQLERKAESNLCVEKDEEGISTIYSLNSRHAHIPKQDGPRYQWDDALGLHMTCQPCDGGQDGKTGQFQRQFVKDDIRRLVSAIDPLSTTEVRKLAEQELGMSKPTFFRLWNALKHTKSIVEKEGKWIRSHG